MTFKVILRYWFIFILVFLLQILHRNSQAADQESFPFLAEISKDSVNIRSGQSENFEKLCQLDKGDEVVVVGRNYSWYKVELPETAQSYLNREFVSLLDASHGVMNAKRVNIRAGIGIHTTILCQLDIGDRVEILEATQDWYKIKPVAGCYGWVSDKLISFKSKNVPIRESKKVGISSESNDSGSVPKEEKGLAAQTISQKDQDAPNGESSITITGFIARVSEKANNNFSFKLVTKDKDVYYLQGLQHVLEEFLHQTVKVEGALIKPGAGQGGDPVINILKFQLVP